MYVVYILYSAKHDKIYIGYTSDLISRFKSHNELGTGWTKRYRQWVVVYVEFYETKQEAMLEEKRLKGGQGRQFIRRHILGK